jgi:tetratricopeptide (TPR) repeat protein
MLDARLLAGSGPGTYSWVRLDFPPPSADFPAVRLLHNVPLQTLVDGGLILGAAVAAALVAWGLAVVARAGSWHWNERIAVACTIGFFAALTLDDFSYVPSVIAAALAIGAFLTPLRAAGQTGFMIPATLALAAIVALPNILAVDVARAEAQAARTAMIAEDYALAVSGFAAATAAHPEHGGYWLGLGMASAYAGNRGDAIEAYERATSAAPGDPRGYGALAALDPAADAIELLRAAADRTTGDAQYAVRLGLALALAGQRDEGVHAWGRAVALHPELLRVLPYAETGISMEAVAEAGILTIHAEPRAATVENLVRLWDLGLALDELPPDAGTAWRAVDAARHGDTERGAALADDAVAAAVYDPRGWEATAAVAAFACDTGAEEQVSEIYGELGFEFLATVPEPLIWREFVYREASLGPTQPPNAGPRLELEPWPWSLIDRPTACES